MPRREMTIARIKIRDMQINQLKAGRDVMLDLFVEESCPYKVGDVREVTGYSYNGMQMKITRISMRKGYSYSSKEYDYSYTFIYHGDIINKDGKVGNRFTSEEVEIKEGTNG